MPKTTILKTNLSGGEASPNIEGRPDLAKFFNMARRLENYWIQTEGGIFRRYGTRKVNEVKNSAYAIGIPFKFANTVAYVIEAGHGYFIFYRRNFNSNPLFQPIRISAGAPILEIVTPYAATELEDLQWTQSADVLYITHPDHQQRKLNRVSDTEWSLSLFIGKPPPSYEADADITDTTGGFTSGSGGDGPPPPLGDDGRPSDDGGDASGDGGGDGGGGGGDGDDGDDGA